MSIDEAIAKIWHCIVSIRECVGNKDFVKALETAIDTMRKYQKIQEIVDGVETLANPFGYSSHDAIDKIKEVLGKRY